MIIIDIIIHYSLLKTLKEPQIIIIITFWSIKIFFYHIIRTKIKKIIKQTFGENLKYGYLVLNCKTKYQ